VGALGERVAARFAVGAELGVHEDEFGSCVDDLRSLHLGFESQHAGVAPAAAKRAVAKFSDGLERRSALGDRR
jgi:hypothetical protein